MDRNHQIETIRQYVGHNWVHLAQISIEKANDGILWLSNQGHIIYANESMANMVGYTFDELCTLHIKDIHPTIPEYEPYFEQLKLKHGKDTIEALYKTKAERLVPVEISGNYGNVDGHEFNCCIVRDISERKRIEAQLAANYLSLKEKEKKIRTISKAYVKAQEEERQSLSIEIHDLIIQRFFILTHQINELDIIKVYEVRQQLIKEIQKSLQAGIYETRHLMTTLFPSSLKRYGLINLFDQELTELEEVLHCKCQMTSNLETKLSHEIETTLYRIGHEGLSNIKRHGHNVRNVMLSLIENATHIELSISDDGQGFDVAEVSKESLHRGIECMQRRAELLNGFFTISSRLGIGTSIETVLPIEGE